MVHCEQCNQEFATNRGLTSHKRIHKQSSTSAPSFKKEVQNDRKRKILFVCDECDKKFLQNINLKEHKSMMHRPPTASSPSSSPEPKKVRRPEVLVPGTDVDEKECDLCNKTFKNNTTLKVHMKRHQQ